jgi:hypothetical protein
MADKGVNPEPTAAQYNTEAAGASEPLHRPPHYIRFSAARLAIMVSVLALAALRLGLDPPLPRATWVLVPGWFFVAAVYHLLQPRQEMPYWFVYLLRLSFFLYEVCVILVVAHHLGGSGWLAILFLLLPTVELNLAFPDRAGSIASLFAALGAAAIVYAEARGWLWHDPFYSVDAPLYREPAYAGMVLVIAFVFLVVLPRWVGRHLESGARS